MEQISITFTSNTGLLMQYGDTKVLFDSLYGKSRHRFSPLPQVLEQEIMEGAGDFSEIDYLVFSHNHADHFSAKYLKAYLQQNTVKGIFLPEDLLQETDLMEFLKAEKIPTMFFSKNPRLNRTIVLGKSFRLRAIPMCHQGEIYQEVPHFLFSGFLRRRTISSDGRCGFYAGRFFCFFSNICGGGFCQSVVFPQQGRAAGDS